MTWVEINFVISYSDSMYYTLLIEEHWKVALELNIQNLANPIV